MTGRLRITGGRLARRLIAVPPAARAGTLRPTSDRVREALFSSLAARDVVDGAVVADLCCGSGALGFEALSRGAASAVFVDSDRRTLAVVGENAKALGLAEHATLVAADVAAFAGGLPQRARFDLVFCDPPYALPLDAPLRRGLTSCLAPGGLLVLERDGRSADPALEGLSLLDERRYGDTRLFLWQRTASSMAATAGASDDGETTIVDEIGPAAEEKTAPKIRAGRQRAH